MNKAEFISEVAKKSNFSKKNAECAVNSVIQTIIETLSQGDKLQLIGFGTFEVRDRAERQGRDPRTNAPITIPASKVPVFRAGKAFKSSVKSSLKWGQKRQPFKRVAKPVDHYVRQAKF